jgi:hypothetical protein
MDLAKQNNLTSPDVKATAYLGKRRQSEFDPTAERSDHPGEEQQDSRTPSSTQSLFSKRKAGRIPSSSAIEPRRKANRTAGAGLLYFYIQSLPCTSNRSLSVPITLLSIASSTWFAPRPPWLALAASASLAALLPPYVLHPHRRRRILLIPQRDKRQGPPDAFVPNTRAMAERREARGDEGVEKEKGKRLRNRARRGLDADLTLKVAGAMSEPGPLTLPTDPVSPPIPPTAAAAAARRDALGTASPGRQAHVLQPHSSGGQWPPAGRAVWPFTRWMSPHHH